ncbi:hypothetical protein BZ16_2529 [Yersinia pseudotuberculosis PB1/+]|uniref:hypothetical protein n=1 Tax=Yersinia pseudotuberculosis TaxID=633 RepID=UPI00017397DD|nr:hypothetical protein [Yersinia pseudotuberculosis]AJJ65927.1 hypothetical protein BZ16_2529 [Yersinia pseudotuberculosis PB1/+]
MAVAPIKLIKELNDIELIEHFYIARISERLLLLERLENKLATLNNPSVSKEEVFKELSNWMLLIKSIAKSSTTNKEAK